MFLSREIVKQDTAPRHTNSNNSNDTHNDSVANKINDMIKDSGSYIIDNNSHGDVNNPQTATSSATVREHYNAALLRKKTRLAAVTQQLAKMGVKPVRKIKN